MTKIKYGKEIILTEAYNESLVALHELIKRIDRIRIDAGDTTEDADDEWALLNFNAGRLKNELTEVLTKALNRAWLTIEE
jgi:hypothetical protein